MQMMGYVVTVIDCRYTCHRSRLRFCRILSLAGLQVSKQDAEAVGMKLNTTSQTLKCPECEPKGVQSKLHIKADHVKAEPNVFWDTDGKKHFHIVDICLETVKCSMGHTFMQVSSAKCELCGWTSIEFLKMLVALAEGVKDAT
jgi:hypothetical protein